MHWKGDGCRRGRWWQAGCWVAGLLAGLCLLLCGGRRQLQKLFHESGFSISSLLTFLRHRLQLLRQQGTQLVHCCFHSHCHRSCSPLRLLVHANGSLRSRDRAMTRVLATSQQYRLTPVGRPRSAREAVTQGRTQGAQSGVRQEWACYLFRNEHLISCGHNC